MQLQANMGRQAAVPANLSKHPLIRFQHDWAPVQLYLPPGQSRTPNVLVYLAQDNRWQQDPTSWFCQGVHWYDQGAVGHDGSVHRITIESETGKVCF